MYPRTVSFVRIFFASFLLLFITITVSAQFKASIQGTVTDSTGALVTGVKVKLTDTGTGKSQEVSTNDEGFYRIAGLGREIYRRRGKGRI